MRPAVGMVASLHGPWGRPVLGSISRLGAQEAALELRLRERLFFLALSLRDRDASLPREAKMSTKGPPAPPCRRAASSALQPCRQEMGPTSCVVSDKSLPLSELRAPTHKRKSL